MPLRGLFFMINRIFDKFFLFFFSISFLIPFNHGVFKTSLIEGLAFISAFILIIKNIKNIKNIPSDAWSFFILLLLIFGLVFYWFKNEKFNENFIFFFLYVTTALFFYNALSSENVFFFKKLSAAICLVGIFTCFFVIAQKINISDYFVNFVAIFSDISNRPYGNLGQSNLTATILLTALCAALFLRNNHIITIPTCCLISIFVGISLGFSGSKTSFLSLFLLIFISSLKKDVLSIFVFAIAVVTIFFTLNFSNHRYSEVDFKKPESYSSENIDISSGRYDLWSSVVESIKQSPISGYGVMNNAKAYWVANSGKKNYKFELINNSHNILLDFCIWFGIPLGMFFSLFFLRNVAVFIVEKFKTQVNMLYMSMPILVHSQLEYPLNYANFLFLFAIIFAKYKNEI